MPVNPLALMRFFWPGGVASEMPSSPIYYVDATGGDDGNDGLSTGAAWKTIAKVNAVTFEPGDTIKFKCGELWREQLDIPSTGTAGLPITFTSYGEGAKPRIYGSDVPESWTSDPVAFSTTLTKVQGASVSDASAAVTRAWPSTPTAGNLLVAFCTGSNADSNAAISGWTKAVAVQTTSSYYAAIFYKVAGAGEGDVALTWTSSVATGLGIEEWSGLVTPVLDKTASTATTGSAVSARSSGTTADTTKNYEVLIAGFAHGSTVSARSYSNSFTEDYDIGSGNTNQIASKTVTTTGAQETTQSWTTARVAGGCIATFGGTEAAIPLYYTAQAANPVYVCFVAGDGTITEGVEVATKAELTSEYKWWFDDPNNRLYVYAATDPATRYASVEVSSTTRDRGIWWDAPSGISKDYITIDGFEIAFVTGNGIVVRNNCIVINNTVHHLGYQAGGHSFGIEINAGSNCRVAGNTVHHTRTSGVLIVASYDDYKANNNVIEDNTVYDAKTYLIEVRCEASTVEMAGNIIRRNVAYHSAGFVPDTNSGFGVRVAGTAAGNAAAANTTQIYYNRITSLRPGVLLDIYTTNAVVYNNTIKTSVGKGINVTATGVTGITLKNNLVADAIIAALDIDDAAAITACDYNLWYAPSATNYVTVGASTYSAAQFADYKTDTSWDAHGLWENPDVVGAADLHLTAASPGIGAGVAVGLTTDLDGVAVGNPPDIGAYEYVA